MIELPRSNTCQPDLCLKIVGIGGAGINVLDRVQLDGIVGAGLIAINTDAGSLASSVAPEKVQLGRESTRGLGAGGDPEIGYVSAIEAVDEIKVLLDGSSLVFICAGLGGGTGSGAAPLIANLARQQNALVVVFATLPFTFEGRRRIAQAEEALQSLRQQADVVICFENDRMGDVVSPGAGIQEAFSAADITLSESIRALYGLLQRRGLINAGFDKIKAALRGQDPRSLFAFGQADGDNRAYVAIERALRSPLMDRGRLLGEARNVLVHVAGGLSMTLNEVSLLMEVFNRHVGDATRVLFSTAVDQKLGDNVSVTILGSLGERSETVESALQVPAEAPIEMGSTERLELADGRNVDSESFLKDSVERFEPSRVPDVEAVPASEVRPSRVARLPAKSKPSREEKQEQMTFEPVNRGRFEKSEPTIVDGQDLDIPAFMRMNVRLK